MRWDLVELALKLIMLFVVASAQYVAAAILATIASQHFPQHPTVAWVCVFIFFLTVKMEQSKSEQ